MISPADKASRHRCLLCFFAEVTIDFQMIASLIFDSQPYFSVIFCGKWLLVFNEGSHQLEMGQGGHQYFNATDCI